MPMDSERIRQAQRVDFLVPRLYNAVEDELDATQDSNGDGVSERRRQLSVLSAVLRGILTDEQETPKKALGFDSEEAGL
jgi:hypothetical protein